MAKTKLNKRTKNGTKTLNSTDRLKKAKIKTKRSSANPKKKVNINIIQDEIRMSEDYCSICLSTEQLQDYEKLICGHQFHHVCIQKWFFSKVTCPICRKVIFVGSRRRSQVHQVVG